MKIEKNTKRVILQKKKKIFLNIQEKNEENFLLMQYIPLRSRNKIKQVKKICIKDSKILIKVD